VKGDSGSIVQQKLNKLKELVSSKKKKALEVTAGKFVSNGSLLSQTGLKTASEADLQNKIIGGEQDLVVPRQPPKTQSMLAIDCSQDEPRPFMYSAHLQGLGGFLDPIAAATRRWITR
jgi:hypothetical protein